MVMRLEVRFTMGFVPNVTSLRRTARRKSRWSCCGAYSGGGPVLSGRKVMVDGEVALGSAINGAVLNRFLRDDGEEWMMHMTFRPDDDFDERVMPERISGYVGTAVSNDGISWTINRAALKPNKEDWWCFDTTHCAVGTVQIMSSDVIRADSGVYFMYYHGGDQEEFVPVDGQEKVKGFRTRIGVAVSLDGANWSRLEGEHYSGAVLDVGSPGCFDEQFVASPQVIKLGDEYRMYYHSRDPRSGVYGVGIATSKDGINFARLNHTPLVVGDGPRDFFERGISDRHVVVKRDGSFYMFFTAVASSGVRSIGAAVSTDGLSWELVRDSAVLTKGTEGSWDDESVSHPYAVQMDDGSIRLYYTGTRISNGQTAIGLARSNTTDWSSLTKYTSK